ncbi:MAG: hypothetical protein H8E12_05170 [Rhodobacteraceae bacterium]|nr:hypothetical protein [Paracoccaceae bacterium]
MREAEHNIRLYKKWWKFASVLDENEIGELLIKQDTMAILELLEGQ